MPYVYRRPFDYRKPPQPPWIGTAASAVALTLTPDPILVPIALPAPAVTLTLAISPDPIIVPIVLPAPTVTHLLVISPTPITIPVVLPDPAVSLTLTVTPTPIAVPIVLPDPTVSLTLTIAPDLITIPVVLPDPVVSLSLTISPDPVSVPIALPDPAVTFGAITISPTPIVVPVVLPAPTLALTLILAPDPIVVPIVLPDPTVTQTGGVTISPDPIIVGIVLPDPTVTVAGAAGGEEPDGVLITGGGRRGRGRWPSRPSFRPAFGRRVHRYRTRLRVVRVRGHTKVKFVPIPTKVIRPRIRVVALRVEGRTSISQTFQRGEARITLSAPRRSATIALRYFPPLTTLIPPVYGHTAVLLSYSKETGAVLFPSPWARPTDVWVYSPEQEDEEDLVELLLLDQRRDRLPPMVSYFKARPAETHAAPMGAQRLKDEVVIERVVYSWLQETRAAILPRLEVKETVLAGKVGPINHTTALPAHFFDLINDEPFWASIEDRFASMLTPLAYRTTANGVIEATRAVGAINFSMANEAVANYAASYTNAWYSQLARTTRVELRQAISKNILAGGSRRDLIRALAPTFGRDRAKRIAATEVTRMYAQGNLIGFERAGIQQVEWRTAQDDRVDEACRQYNNNTYPIGNMPITPPVHVSCRCWLTPVMGSAASTPTAQARPADPNYFPDWKPSWKGQPQVALREYTEWTRDMLQGRGYTVHYREMGFGKMPNGAAAYADWSGKVVFGNSKESMAIYRGMLSSLKTGKQLTPEQRFYFDAVNHEMLHLTNPVRDAISYSLRPLRFFEEGVTEAYSRALSEQVRRHLGVDAAMHGSRAYSSNVNLINAFAREVAYSTGEDIVEVIDRWKKLTDQREAFKLALEEVGRATKVNAQDIRNKLADVLGLQGLGGITPIEEMQIRDWFVDAVYSASKV